MAEVAATGITNTTNAPPDGLKLLSQGTLWIIGGAIAGCLIVYLSDQTSFYQMPAHPVAASILVGTTLAAVGVHRLIIGGIHYAREVWKSS